MGGQGKGPIFSLWSYRRVYTPSTILLKSVTGRLLHSYVRPSIYDYPCIAVAQHRKEGIQMTENPCYAAVTDYYNVVNVP